MLNILDYIKFSIYCKVTQKSLIFKFKLLFYFMARKLDLDYNEIIEKIVEKKEFSELPLEDVKLVYSQFEKREDLILEEKIKFTRDLLRKMYTAFVSNKLLSVKDKDADWFLRKHISTAERLGNYDLVYHRVLEGIESKKGELVNVFDFGCGINGFSYNEFLSSGFNVNYVGTEPVGQLCKLQNNWFKDKKLNARVENLSLFNLNSNVNLINSTNGKKVVFFFKVLDSLEMLKKDYSKDVLEKIVPLVDRVVVSWATGSLVKKKKFFADRKWLKEFISKNFKILDEFEVGMENYLVFSKRK